MTPTPFDLIEMTVADVARELGVGTSAEALTHACLDRIGSLNHRYNAIITLNHSALDDARALDRRRWAGEALGPLAGVPVVVKDTMDVAGLPSTGGWHFLSARAGGIDLIPATDAPVVARLRAAGCIILGKTNVPIMSATGSHANDSWAGPTLNAAVPDLLPGGSSAGTATAVAASMAVLGLGEETGGSIQNPASAQGLVGVKPTFALVPNVGVMPLAGSTRDVVGPITRCVRDAALVMDALAGYDAADPKTVAAIGRRPRGGYAAGLSTTALQGKRLGLYGRGWRDRPLSAGTAALYARAQDEIRSRGAALVEDPFVNSDFASIGKPVEGLDHYDTRGLETIAQDMHAYLQRLGADAAITTFSDFAALTKREDCLGPDGVLNFVRQAPGFERNVADPLATPDVTEFINARERYLQVFSDVFDREGLDALVFPQMRDSLPPLHGPDTIHETTVCEINVAGLPGVTVPAGVHESGAPFNLIFVGPLWSEAELLAIAFDYEQAFRYRQAPQLA